MLPITRPITAPITAPITGADLCDPVAQLFANNEPGADYDFGDRSTLFQDTAGTTPVTAVEQTVALILDKSRPVRLGPELVTNGDFSSGTTGWTITGAWAESGGQFVKTGGSSATASQSILTIGKTYRVTVDVVAVATSVLIYAGSGNAQTITTPGLKTFTLVCLSDTNLYVQCLTTATATIDNISVRELPGVHQQQSTPGSRAVLRSRYNLLTWSEDFSNAGVWQANGVTVTANAVIAPDGTLTADQVVFAGNELDRLQQPPAGLGLATYTFSCWARVASGTASLRFGDATSLQVVTLTSTWQLFTTTFAVSGPNFTWRNEAAGGAKTIFLWGADLRPAIDTYLPYQRINAATDYATGPQFPTYLEYDGVDDSYASAANLDLSSTDKVTVFAAVTKLSDAASGGLVELSADASTNTGAFAFYLPNSGGFAEYYWRSRGTQTANTNALGFAAPITNVITGIGDISGDAATLRVNGAQVGTSVSDQGTGNYGSYPLFLGRRNNASLPFRGRMYRVIVRGAATPVGDVSAVESALNVQAGKVY